MSENNKTDFQLTGKNIPVNKIELIKYVHQILYYYQIQLHKNEVPKIDPFKESLIITNGNNNIMIPHDIQNEAIKIYIENPQIFEYYLKLDNNKLENQNKLNTNDKDDNNDNEQDKGGAKEKDESLYGIIFCIIFFYLITQCAPRLWNCEEDE